MKHKKLPKEMKGKYINYRECYDLLYHLVKGYMKYCDEDQKENILEIFTHFLNTITDNQREERK